MTTATEPRRAWVEQVMGLPVSLHARGPALDDAATARIVARVFADLRHADAVFSTYRPATAVRAVTVVGPNLLRADVYATAAAARGPWALDWLDGLDGYGALLVTASGLQRVSAGWPASAPQADEHL
jgi:hypothetical protein